MRARVPPIEARTAISFARDTPRISSRLATLAQAISRTSTPAVMNAIQVASVADGLYCSLIGLTVVWTRPLVSGKWAVQTARVVVSSASAAAGVTPSFSLPKTESRRASRGSAARPGMFESGIHRSAVPGNRKPTGMMPTMVTGWPSTVTVRPRIAESPP